MKYNRIALVCIIVLITIQIIPINMSIEKIVESDSVQINSQEIKSSAKFDPPQVLRYISPPQLDFGINYDMIREFSFLATIIFDPLVEYSFNTGELIPALAKQWVVTNNSRNWIFTLRDDVNFSDGTKFNATSVKFTYDRFIDPTHPAYVADPFIDFSQMPLESIEILDEYKVSINFNQSYAPFIYQEAALCGIYSPNSFSGGPNITEPIGTGPYYLDKISSNSTFQKFIRNDQYFRGVPPFEEIQYIKYGSMGNFQAAVENHEGEFTTIGINPLPENDTYWEESLAIDGIQYGYFNHLHPILNDQNVRLAINYAVNKQMFTNYYFENLNKGVHPLRSVIYSGDLYNDKSIQGYPYNVDLANTILDSSGYPRLGDGYRFDIELVGFERSYEKVSAIKADLNLVGIHCTTINGTRQNLKAGNFDLFVVGWVPITDPSLSRRLLHTSGDINYGRYSNSEADLFTSLGQQTPIRQEREYYYFQVQRLAQEDAPLLLIQETKGIYLRAKEVTPFVQMNRMGRIIFNYTVQLQDIDIYKMEKIEVSSDPIYLPFTDGVIALESQHFEGNMTMTHDLSNLISNQQETGKFYELQVNRSKSQYLLRCYYDLDEIDYSNPLEEQEVFQWNYTTQSWNKLEVVSSNPNLRFSEVKLKGNAILRLGQKNLILLTFVYLPIILIIIGPIIVLASLTIIKNRKIMKNVKKEFDLT
ncbi:MAG: ABC transporter substrate-binding protein [Promethearchaeota archaeon]